MVSFIDFSTNSTSSFSFSKPNENTSRNTNGFFSSTNQNNFRNDNNNTFNSRGRGFAGGIILLISLSILTNNCLLFQTVSAIPTGLKYETRNSCCYYYEDVFIKY
jgi:hypothetical protein